MISLIVTIFFITFITFGGGSVFIPMFEGMFVDSLGYFTTDEFNTVVAVVSALPGLVGGRIASYTGYHQYGWIGFFFAYIAFILPGYGMMMIFYRLYMVFEKSKIMDVISTFIKPIVIAIFLYLIVYFFDITFVKIGIIESIIVFGVAFVLIDRVKIKPIYVVLIALTYSVGIYYLL